MNVTPTMRNGIGTRTSDESVRQWATGRLAREGELDGPLGKVLTLTARSVALAGCDQYSISIVWLWIRISPAGEPATGDNLTRSFLLPASHRMSLFKKLKKSLQPSKKPAVLGIPTHIAAGPLGFGAELDRGVDPEGVLRSAQI